MKIKPEIFLNNNENILYNKILITGSDETFINYVRDCVVQIFKNKNYFIDSSNNYKKGLTGDLFSDKKILFLLKEYSPKEDGLKSEENANQSFLIFSPNSKKINTIKNEFSKSKNSLLLECYPLNKKNKEIILKGFVEKNNMDISDDVFWYIIENFEERYVLFTQQLKTLSLLKTKINSIELVERAVFVNNKIDLNKMLFHIYRQNKYIINTFNKNISSQTDFYIFLNTLKMYFGIISSADSKEGALLKFPRYLFGEKDVFIKLYNQLDKGRLFKIYKNIFKAECLVRKNPNLYNVIGLRFFLNIKKIIIS